MPESPITKLLNESSARRIAVIKPSALGDVVQTLPLLGVLKKRFPDAEIDWVIRSELAGLLQGHPHLSEVIPYYRHGGLKSWIQLLRKLRKRQYDLVFDLQGLLRTGVMTLATGATLRVGLETARECSHWACHGLLPETEKSVPAYARYWRIAELFGLQNEPRSLNLGITSSDHQAATRALKTLENANGPLMVIHPGAKWETKRWPVAQFAEIAIRTFKKYGMRIAVIGTKGEHNDAESIVAALKQHVPNAFAINLAGKTSLRELAVILGKADLVLTNDSGPMHLAAGMGTPVVGIFTCTSTERSGPPGSHHQLLQAKVPCAASYRKTCPYTGSAQMQCMQAVSIFQVWTGIQKAVEENKILSRVA